MQDKASFVGRIVVLVTSRRFKVKQLENSMR